MGRKADRNTGRQKCLGIIVQVSLHFSEGWFIVSRFIAALLLCLTLFAKGI